MSVQALSEGALTVGQEEFSGFAHGSCRSSRSSTSPGWRRRSRHASKPMKKTAAGRGAAIRGAQGDLVARGAGDMVGHLGSPLEACMAIPGRACPS